MAEIPAFMAVSVEGLKFKTADGVKTKVVGTLYYNKDAGITVLVKTEDGLEYFFDGSDIIESVEE